MSRDVQDSGMTLLEVLLALSISSVLLVITGSAFTVSFRSSDESTARLTASHAGSFTSAHWLRDVQSSRAVNVGARCAGTGNLVLSLALDDATADHVDYRYTSGTLTRVECGARPSTVVVASGLAGQPAAPCSAPCTGYRSLSLTVQTADGSFTLSGRRRSA